MSTVVFAATSQTGSSAIQALLGAGVQNIVAVARSKAKIAHLESKGVKLVEADVKDSAAVSKALEGAKAAYIINPPTLDGSDPSEVAKISFEAYEHGLSKNKVQRAVLLSSIGGEKPSGTGAIETIHKYEVRLPSVVPEVVILRASFFLSNWDPSLQGARASPHTFKVLSAQSSHPFDQVAPTDIGKIAAKYLAVPASELPSSGPLIVELKGPEAYSVDQVAKEVEKVLGGPVQVATTPDDQLEGTLKAFGLPPALQPKIAEMYRAFGTGFIDWTGEGKVERGSTTAGEYVAQFYSDKK